jgi:transposase InsO family protein
MRVGALRARLVRVYRPKAGTHRWFGQHPNHVRRTHATGPNQIWVGDLTYLPVGRRWWDLVLVSKDVGATISKRTVAWKRILSFSHQSRH